MLFRPLHGVVIFGRHIGRGRQVEAHRVMRGDNAGQHLAGDPVVTGKALGVVLVDDGVHLVVAGPKQDTGVVAPRLDDYRRLLLDDMGKRVI